MTTRDDWRSRLKERLNERRERALKRIGPDFKAELKRVRGLLGETQEQFAKRFGVTRDALRQWEEGRRKPRAQGATRLLLGYIELDHVSE